MSIEVSSPVPPPKARLIFSSPFIGALSGHVVTPFLAQLLADHPTMPLGNFSSKLGIFDVSIVNGVIRNATAGKVSGGLHGTSTHVDGASQSLYLSVSGASAYLEYELHVKDIGHRPMQSSVGNATSVAELSVGTGTAHGGVSLTVVGTTVTTDNVLIFANTSHLGGVWKEVEHLLETHEGQRLLNSFLDSSLDEAGAPFLQALLANETARFLPPVFPLNTTAGQVLDLAVAAVNDTTAGLLSLDLTANVHNVGEAVCSVPRSQSLPTVDTTFRGFLLSLDESAVSCALPTLLAAVSDAADAAAGRLFTRPSFTLSLSPNATLARDGRVTASAGLMHASPLPLDVSFARDGSNFLVLGASFSASLGLTLSPKGEQVSATIASLSVSPSLVALDESVTPPEYVAEIQSTFGDPATLANLTATLDARLLDTVLPALAPSLVNHSTHLPPILAAAVDTVSLSLSLGQLKAELTLVA